MIVKATETNFQTEVYNRHGAVLVEFYASWCPKCAMMEDILKEFSQKHPEISVCQVNIGGEHRLPDEYGIEKVPSFIAFDNGKPVGAVVGVVPAEVLLELFSSVK